MTAILAIVLLASSLYELVRSIAHRDIISVIFYATGASILAYAMYTYNIFGALP